MGFFSGFKGSSERGQAQDVIKGLIDQQLRFFATKVDSAAFAKELVSRILKARPDWFDGPGGERPKTLLAAVALANGVYCTDKGSANRKMLARCTSIILADLEANGYTSGMDEVALHMIEEAAAENASETATEDAGSLPSKGFPYKTFEAWFTVFKKGAAETNSKLKIDDKDGSLVDFMDHAPLKLAYRDMIEPRSLGRSFGEQWTMPF